MKCSNCGKGEIVTPNPNQSIDDYLNTKNVVIVVRLETGKWSNEVNFLEEIHNKFCLYLT